MKVVFAAQGSILKVFHAMDVQLRSEGHISGSAYWIADSEYYESNKSCFDVLRNPTTPVLKEWEYTGPSSMGLPENWSELEKKYEPFGCLWDAVVADRRLMYGRLCKTKQQYKGHFTHENLQEIVFSALSAIDKLLTEFKPDRIVTFVPATFGDILLSHAAKVHRIDYRVLRVTKVSNYVAFSDQLGSSSTWLETAYQNNLKDIKNSPFYNQAQIFLEQGMASPVEYEGSISSKKHTVSSLLKRYVFGAVGAIVQQCRRVRLGVTSDNHLPPVFSAYVYANLFREYRERRALKLMRARGCSLEEIKGQSFVFYPMHCEPEVAMSVYGKEHQNQIETIRRIAQNIPLSWKLVVKEHPRSISSRTIGYYNKLLDIPNLYFADMNTKPFYWNQLAKVVVTVSGFSGFEAAMVRTPVIVLGDASFSVLPRTMLRTVRDMALFSVELKDLLGTYRCSEDHLLAYIMANMQVGIDVNLYSELLEKSGRVTMSSDSAPSQIGRLAKWLVDDFMESHDFVN